MREILVEKLSVDGIAESVGKRISELEEVLRAQATKSSKGEGKIKVTKNKSRYQYYIKNAEHPRGKYLNKKALPLIKKLCQNYYENKATAVISGQLKALKKFFAAYTNGAPESVYEKLNGGIKKHVVPYVYDEETFSELWAASGNDHISLPFPEDMPELISTAGIRVRSKSEMMIADGLFKNGVLFKYEFPLVMHNGQTLYPDFICVNKKNHRQYIWEHFGLMDDSEYVDKMVKKDNLYRRSGYSQGRNLIYTFETKQVPITSRDIEEIIEDYLM